MDYSNFLLTWDNALNTAGLNSPGLFPEQSVGLRSMDRTYRAFVPFGLIDHRIQSIPCDGGTFLAMGCTPIGSFCNDGRRSADADLWRAWRS